MESCLDCCISQSVTGVGFVLFWYLLSSNGCQSRSSFAVMPGASLNERRNTLMSLGMTLRSGNHSKGGCCGRETTRCRCKIRYVTKFTAASRGSPYDSMAFLYDIFCFLADRTVTQYDRLLAILSSVRPSVCLWRCALWLSGLTYRAKSCSIVFLACIFLFVPSDTFSVGCII